MIVDAWKNALRYRYNDPDQINPESDFDLWSLGPDGKGHPGGSDEETADDIKNW